MVMPGSSCAPAVCCMPPLLPVRALAAAGCQMLCRGEALCVRHMCQGGQQVGVDLLPCAAAICSSQIVELCRMPLARLCTLGWLDILQTPAHTWTASEMTPSCIAKLQSSPPHFGWNTLHRTRCCTVRVQGTILRVYSRSGVLPASMCRAHQERPPGRRRSGRRQSPSPLPRLAGAPICRALLAQPPGRRRRSSRWKRWSPLWRPAGMVGAPGLGMAPGLVAPGSAMVLRQLA